MGVLAFGRRSQNPGIGGLYILDREALCDNAFHFTHDEDKQAVLARFEKWFNQVLVRGLDQWRKQL
jgi:hypothetical protein